MPPRWNVGAAPASSPWEIPSMYARSETACRRAGLAALLVVLLLPRPSSAQEVPGRDGGPFLLAQPRAHYQARRKAVMEQIQKTDGPRDGDANTNGKAGGPVVVV